MPRRRRIAKSRKLEGLTKGQRLVLLKGSDFFGFLSSEGIEFTEGEQAIAWAMHRDALLSEWIARRPGTRPAAWWKYEAPEPRRLMQPGEWPPQEHEQDYLARLGLLTPHERSLVSLGARRSKVGG